MASDDQRERILESDDEDDDVESQPSIKLKPRGRCQRPRGFGTIVVGMTVFAVAVLISLVINILVGVKPKPADPTHYGVTSDSDQCAKIGDDVLLKGGNAVDGAVAVLFCLGVVHPHSSGIGGGGFMVVRNGSSTMAYNFREAAPNASTTDMYNGDADKMEIGGLAVGVPGEVKGLERVHSLYGELEWKDVVMPAANLAQQGFKLEKALREALSFIADASRTRSALRKYSKPILDQYMRNGVIPEVNSVIRNTQLGKTLEQIANDRGQSFYGGDVARAIVTAVKDAGGIMTLQDLQSYTCKDETPVVSHLTDGWTMYGAPLPASGVVLSFITNILSGYDQFRGSVLDYHRMVEAFKFAYAKRSFLADPGFNHSMDVNGIVNSVLLNKTYADEVRKQGINDTHTYQNVSHYGGEYDVPGKVGTTHVSVVSGQTAVSVTSTVNTYFGSMVLAGDTGIVLNNEMDDFAAPNITNFFGLPPAEPNFVEPGKRPLSSQSPTIVCDGNGTVRLVVGASGGTKITTSTYQVYAKVHMQSMDVYNAVLEPRLHDQLFPTHVSAETDMAESIVQGLRAKGHTVFNNYTSLAVVQAIERTANGTLRAQADVVRKGGGSYVG